MEDNPLVEWILKLIKMHALKGIKRTIQKNEERIFKGTTIAGFEVSKAVLASETQQMVASTVAATVVSGLFLEFMFGVGPKDREFGPGSLMAVRMQDAYGVKEAKKYFYETRSAAYKKSPASVFQKPLKEYSAGFNPALGPIRAWDDVVEQFIGNYMVEIHPDQKATQMEIVCTNVTSIHSFLYHIPFIKNRERSNGIIPAAMGNIKQTIYWHEPIDTDKFK